MIRPAAPAEATPVSRPSATILPMPRAATAAGLIRPRCVRRVAVQATPGWIEI